MSMHERTGVRPLYYNDWHRPPTLPDRVRMIDIDCVEYDPKTSEPVRIAETVRTWTGKPTTVLRNIARKLNVEAWLIVYFLQPTEDGNDLTIGFFEAKIVYPSEGKLQRYSAEEFAKFWVESFDALCAKARGETAR